LVIDQLAYSLNRRDEEPNIRLAEKIASSNDQSQVEALFALLDHKNKSISSDAIKVIDEIALRNPALIKSKISVLIKLLGSKNNRLQWGAMAALDNITTPAPDQIYKHLSAITHAADKGSVITRDRCVSLLNKLATHKKYEGTAIPLLFEILLKAPDNQFAMYAEEIVTVLDKRDHKSFQKIISDRLPDLEKDSQKKRVQKVIKKVN